MSDEKLYSVFEAVCEAADDPEEVAESADYIIAGRKLSKEAGLDLIKRITLLESAMTLSLTHKFCHHASTDMHVSWEDRYQGELANKARQVITTLDEDECFSGLMLMDSHMASEYARRDEVSKSTSVSYIRPACSNRDKCGFRSQATGLCKYQKDCKYQVKSEFTPT